MKKKIQIHACSKFRIVKPICTIETLEEGMSGYIRSDDIYIYTKNIESNDFYFRLAKNAPVYNNFTYEYSMISICKVDNIIEIEAEPEAYFFANISFDGDPHEFTNEQKIDYEEYNPDIEFEEPFDEVKEILTKVKDVHDMHKRTVEYFYSPSSEETGMDKLLELVPPKVKNRLKEINEDDIKTFKEQIDTDGKEWKENSEDLEYKTGPRKQKMQKLKLYLDTIKTIISKVFIDEEELLKLSIDVLIDMHESEENPNKKSIIQKVLTQKCKPKGG